MDNPNVRPGTMARIETAAQAQAFIAEQVEALSGVKMTVREVAV